MNVLFRIIVFCFMLPMGLWGQQHEGGYEFYVGTYTNGQSKGIYRCRMGDDGTLLQPMLIAHTTNPSFLTFTRDHKFLLAVNETKSGKVASFAVIGDTLLPVNFQSSGGAYPCHVSVNDKGYVLVSNYGSGTVGVLKINQKGVLSHLLYVDEHKIDGLTAHAHESKFLGRHGLVVSVDLGLNRLLFSQWDSLSRQLVPLRQKTLVLLPGSGPRHFVFSPETEKMYVVNETGNTVSIVSRQSDGTWVLGKTVSTLPQDFKGKSYCAEIQRSQDGRFLYVSNRGFNSIALFKISLSGNNLTLVGNFPVHGDFPRFFTLTPDGRYLLVANQKSGNIVVFKRNGETGRLLYLDEITISSPVCILFR